MKESEMKSGEIKDGVSSQASLIGLPIDPAHLPGTVRNLELIALLAKLYMEFPLDPEVEPANVYSHERS